MYRSRVGVLWSVVLAALFLGSARVDGQREEKDRKDEREAPLPFTEIRLPEGRPHNIVFSVDGSKMAVGLASKIVVCNSADGKDLVRMQLPAESWNHGLAFSADAKTLLWHAVDDKTARVFDVKTGRQVREFRHFGADNPSCSPDARRLIYRARGKGFDMFDVATGKRVAHIDDGARFGPVFSRDGKVFALQPSDKELRLYATDTGQYLRSLTRDPGVKDRFDYVSFSADGSRIAVWERSNKSPLEIWDVSTGKLLSTAQLPFRPLSAHLARDNESILLVHVWQETVLYRLGVEKRVHSFRPPLHPNFAAFTRDEKKVVVLGPSTGRPNSERAEYSIYLYDVPRAFLPAPARN